MVMFHVWTIIILKNGFSSALRQGILSSNHWKQLLFLVFEDWIAGAPDLASPDIGKYDDDKKK